MNNKNKFLVKTILTLLFLAASLPLAAQNNSNPRHSFFSLSFYKPNYVLPFYYTQYPDQEVYYEHTPENQSLKPYEVKYQLSFKAPLWENIFNNPSTLYLAYSQLSYWQAYNKSA
jgi:outer membrane phospholipase A